jgi:preprotein translocase subunit SecG
MASIILVIHIITCIVLVASVLLQTGRGESLSSMFGGGGGDMFFGATGASKFLAKITTVAAIVFMISSITLAKIKWKSAYKSVIKEKKVEQPVKKEEIKDLEQKPVTETQEETEMQDLQLNLPENITTPDTD